MLLTRKRNKHLHPPLLMDNTALDTVDWYKHLGLIFSNDCSWHTHIKEITKKAWPRLNILRAFKYKLDRNSLERMYISFLRPVLEYGGTIFDNCTKEDKSRIESIQIDGMRIVTGATKLCSIANMILDGKHFRLDGRSKYFLIFYKMLHGLTPNYLNNFVPPLVQENSQFSLRNASNKIISTLQSSTNLHYNSFLPSAIREWNNLSDEIRNSKSFLNFKSKLYSDRTRPPKYFKYGF